MRGREGNSAESGRSEGAWEGDSSSASLPWTARPLLDWSPDKSGKEGGKESMCMARALLNILKYTVLSN